MPRVVAQFSIAVTALALAGCAAGAGDANLDGVYFGDNRGSPGRITIEGETVVFEGFECPPGSPATPSWSAEKSVGVLDADRTEVTWTQTGAWNGTTTLTTIRDGIELGGFVFLDLDAEAGEDELAQATAGCEKE